MFEYPVSSPSRRKTVLGPSPSPSALPITSMELPTVVRSESADEGCENGRGYARLPVNVNSADPP